MGALRFLHEHEWFPDVVVGTSIGAVNGAALASGHSAQSLWALWRRLRTEHVQKPNLNPLQNHFLLDTAPLRETLMEDGWLDFGRINSAEARVHLRLTATEVDTGKLFVYGNSPDIFPSQTQIAPLTIDHIIASCSIPLIYLATKLDVARILGWRDSFQHALGRGHRCGGGRYCGGVDDSVGGEPANGRAPP